MKMRKILSFVLVLSLVLGSFSMAFAATPSTGLSDIAGIANEDAIQVNNDLGIIKGFPDGTFLPEKAVTRAEFAAMITRALAVPESALAGYTSTTFKDTAGYGWAVPYLAFAQSKGIMIGDGMGNVMPGRTINVNEAMTMVLRAIGYVNHSAELVGTWPSNYVTVAQNVGLYDDVAATLTVDRANAAQIIYNALTVQKVSVNADGDTRYLTVSGSTEAAVLLNTGLGCDTFAGVVLGTAGYSYDDAVFNITKKLGAFGDAYVKDGDVVAFAVKDSVALTGEISDGKFEVAGVKYNFPTGWDLAASEAAVQIENGVSVAPTVLGSVAHDDDFFTINAKLSGKTMTVVHSVVGWTANDAKAVTSGDLKALADGELLNGEFDLNDDDEIVASSYALVGAASLDDIKADDVVYIYHDGDYIRKVAVGTEVVTGKVTEVDGQKVYVDGKAYSFYEVASAPVAAETALPNAGDEVELTLDAFGKVFDVEATGKADTFGVVLGSDLVAADSIDDSRLKLYTSEDVTKTFTLASGSDMKWTPANPWTTSATLGAIVKYGLNSDGEINKIEVDKFVTAGAAEVTLESISILHVDADKLIVNEDVVVFVYDSDDYTVTDIKNVDTRAELNTFANFCYVTNTDGEVVAMVIDDQNASKDADDIYAVVTKVTATVDANGDPVQRIIGFADGAALDKKTNFDSSYAAPTTVGALSVFKFTLDADGMIKSSGTAIAGSYKTATISGINSAKTTITLGTVPYALADGVKVYEVVTKTDGTLVDTYKVSSVDALRVADNYVAHIYDMIDDSDNRGYEVVVFVKY